MRPLTVPQPVTTPSPGIFALSMPKSVQRCSTNMSNSSNEPSSRRTSIRSRAVSLPRLCWASILACPPPRRALARRCSSLSTISRIPSPPPLLDDVIAESGDSLPQACSRLFQQLQESHCRVEVAATGGASGFCFDILPPVLDLPVLIEMGRIPCPLGCNRFPFQHQRDERGAGEGGHGVNACQFPFGAFVEIGTDGRHGVGRLIGKHDSSDHPKLRPQILFRPGDNGI